jgi:hypothetical protein
MKDRMRCNKMKWSLATQGSETILLICLLFSNIPENTDDWPMFQHDVQQKKKKIQRKDCAYC